MKFFFECYSQVLQISQAKVGEFLLKMIIIGEGKKI